MKIIVNADKDAFHDKMKAYFNLDALYYKDILVKPLKYKYDFAFDSVGYSKFYDDILTANFSKKGKGYFLTTSNYSKRLAGMDDDIMDMMMNDPIIEFDYNDEAYFLGFLNGMNNGPKAFRDESKGLLVAYERFVIMDLDEHWFISLNQYYRIATLYSDSEIQLPAWYVPMPEKATSF